MRFYLFSLMILITASCEYDEEKQIENSINLEKDDALDSLNMEKVYSGEPISNNDSVFSERFKDSKIESYYLLSDEREEKMLSIKKGTTCLPNAYSDLNFSFEISSDYNVEYCNSDGSLISVSLTNDDTLISNLKFLTVEFYEGYSDETHSENFLNFKKDESMKNVEVSIVSNKYFGKNSYSTISFYSGRNFGYKNKGLYSLQMLIPSLENNIYLLCVLSKSKIDLNFPFSKLEKHVFETLKINSVAISDIIDSFDN